MVRPSPQETEGVGTATAISSTVGLALRKTRIIGQKGHGSLFAPAGLAFSAMIAMSIPEAAEDIHAGHETGTIGRHAALPLGFCQAQVRAT